VIFIRWQSFSLTQQQPLAVLTVVLRGIAQRATTCETVWNGRESSPCHQNGLNSSRGADGLQIRRECFGKLSPRTVPKQQDIFFIVDPMQCWRGASPLGMAPFGRSGAPAREMAQDTDQRYVVSILTCREGSRQACAAHETEHPSTRTHRSSCEVGRQGRQLRQLRTARSSPRMGTMLRSHSARWCRGRGSRSTSVRCSRTQDKRQIIHFSSL
jgi:hypothetical protein